MNRENYFKMIHFMRETNCDPIIKSELERVGYQAPLSFQGVFPLMIGAIVGQKIKFAMAQKIRSQIYVYCENRNYSVQDFIIRVWRQKSSLNYLRSIGLQEFHINAIRQVIGLYKLPENTQQEWNNPKHDENDMDSNINLEMSSEIKSIQNQFDLDKDIPIYMIDTIFSNIKGIGRWTIENVKLTYLMSLSNQDYQKYRESYPPTETEITLIDDKIIKRNFKYLFGEHVNILDKEKNWGLEWKPFILWTLWRGWTLTPDNQSPFQQK
jgi:hypothetical protein